MTAGHQPGTALVWFKSSYSGGNTTECVETAIVPGSVLIRDSKRPGSLHLTVSACAWTRFVAEARSSSRGASA
ncbi:DUF397 domain-containing protein [Streptomyces sp. NPDC002589]|uniref:DUF397 domain-containing protein n=1 Tax=Streptomyces sp. NPDC002589 TaxID=3154420 RepID=UPI003329F26A